jgi:hypothetical protein
MTGIASSPGQSPGTYRKRRRPSNTCESDRARVQRELPGMRSPSRAVPDRMRMRSEIERGRTGPEMER